MSEDPFREMWDRAYPQIAASRLLMKLLQRLKITNIVATVNLNVRDINLSAIAAEHPFCNYHRGTFAAMGVRIPTPKCSALIYPAGVVVCMGTQSEPNTFLAAQKYVEVLNKYVGIPCEMTGLQMDNYVCSVYTFRLDLEHGIRPEWTNVIEFDGDKFPGAIVRCKFMGLPFKTNVHMAFFRSGKINITGARSRYEALYLFVCVYFEYLVHMRYNSRNRAGGAGGAAAPPPEMWKMPVVVRTDIKPPVVEDHHAHLLRYMERMAADRRAGHARAWDVKVETRGRGGRERRIYSVEGRDGRRHMLNTDELDELAPDVRDVVVATAVTTDDPDYDFNNSAHADDDDELDMPRAEPADF